jgi:hypothetical protein
MDIKNVYDAVIFTSALLSIKETLIGAVKSGADLRGADLRGAELCMADLRGADLCMADLRGAELCMADLRGAVLCGADLRGADLRGAELCGAELCGADLRGAKSADQALARIQFLPETGSFDAWKKCRYGVIVKLSVPEDAQRSHGSERKGRASKARVLEVFGAEIGLSGGGYDTIEYRKGQTVTPDSWDTDRWNVCSHGIHFFLTRVEAESYEL